MSIIKSLEKLRKNLDESTAEKKTESKSSSAADVVDLSKETPKIIQPNILTHKETNHGKQDFQHVFRLAANAENKVRGYYKRYSDKNRYLIGKYASENGPVPAVRKFKGTFPNLNESTVRSMRRKYQEELKVAFVEKRAPATTIVSQQRGRPLL